MPAVDASTAFSIAISPSRKTLVVARPSAVGRVFLLADAAHSATAAVDFVPGPKPPHTIALRRSVLRRELCGPLRMVPRHQVRLSYGATGRRGGSTGAVAMTLTFVLRPLPCRLITAS